MKDEYLKTLWMLRFEKVKRGEDHAVETYHEIMERCAEAFGEEDLAVSILGRLVTEEKAHAMLAEKMMQICFQTHPEFEAIKP